MRKQRRRCSKLSAAIRKGHYAFICSRSGSRGRSLEHLAHVFDFAFRRDGASHRREPGIMSRPFLTRACQGGNTFVPLALISKLQKNYLSTNRCTISGNRRCLLTQAVPPLPANKPTFARDVADYQPPAYAESCRRCVSSRIKTEGFRNRSAAKPLRGNGASICPRRQSMR